MGNNIEPDNKVFIDFNAKNVIEAGHNLFSCVDFVSFYSELESLFARFGGCSKFSCIIYYDELKEFYVDSSNYFSSEHFNTVPVNLENSGLYINFSMKQSFYRSGNDEINNLYVSDKEAPIVGCEPLTYNNQIYGLMVFHEAANGKEINSKWLEILSNLAALRIINLQLYQETNQEASENSAKLWAINNAGELLSHMNLDVLLVKIMELSLSIVSAQVGSIILDEKGVLDTKVEWGLNHEIMTKIMHASGGPLIEFVKESQEPFLVDNASEDSRIDISSLDVELEAIIIIPLFTNDKFLGMLNIVNPSGSQTFSKQDIELLVTITNLLSISIENAILYKEALEKERIREQLNIARKIQQDLMPAEAPQFEDYDISGINITCDETGGDYYDYFSPEPDKFMNIVVGDVSGHGIGAALFMATARAHIRASITNMESILKAMSTINNLLIEDMEKNDHFMTLFILRLDLSLMRIKYISAGHETSIIYRKSNDSFIELKSTGLPVGLIEDAEFKQAEHQLQAGDILFLYTDGIKEAMNEQEELYGYERIKEMLKQNSALPVDEIRQEIISDVEKYCSGYPQQDDWTVVIIKVKDDGSQDIEVASQETNQTQLAYTQKKVSKREKDGDKEYKDIAVFIDEEPEITGSILLKSQIESSEEQKEDLIDEVMAMLQHKIEISKEAFLHLRLSVDEALTNGVKHGNKYDKNKNVWLNVLKDSDKVAFFIKDEGPGFSKEKFNELFGHPNETYKESGRGVFLISQLMDEVIYFNQGRNLLMKKQVDWK